MAYPGTVDLISGIRPKNNGEFPLVNAEDVYVDDNTRLDTALDKLTDNVSDLDYARLYTDILENNGEVEIEPVYVNYAINESTGEIALPNTKRILTENLIYIPEGANLITELSDTETYNHFFRYCFDKNKRFLSRVTEGLADGTFYVRLITARKDGEDISPQDVKIAFTVKLEKETPYELIDDINNEIGIDNVVIDPVVGYYINASGAERQISSFNRSNPIEITKGTIVEFTATGYDTNVSMIATSDQNGTVFQSKVLSVDSTQRTYSYTANENCYIVVSYKNNEPYSLTLFHPISNKSLNERLNSTDDAVDGLVDLENNGIYSIGVISTSVDLNNLENNTFCNINSGLFTKDVNHVPIDGFNGIVITLCGLKNQTVIRSQIAISGKTDNKFFWRQFYSEEWTEWSNIASTDDVAQQIIDKSAYLSGTINNTIDLNSLGNGTIYNLNSSGTTQAINHTPINDFQGTILTLCGVKNQTQLKSQIAIQENGTGNVIYTRTKYSDEWTDWTILLSTQTAVECKGTLGVNSDLNNLLPGTIWNINSTSLTENTNHVPIDGFSGAIVTLCGKKNQDVIIAQLALSGGSTRSEVYYRKYYTSWDQWYKFAFTSDINQAIESAVEQSKHLSVLHCFDNIVCCGDSLTYSQVYTGSSTNRQAHITYPMALGKITGVPTIGIATPGYTAINWWTNYETNIVANNNQLAIIYLGTNGGFTDTLSTDAPINTDPSNWANTNTGCLAKIVSKWISVGAKVCLVKCYATSGTDDSDIANTNKVITDVAERFGCGLAENNKLTDNVYHYWPNLEGINSVHYNDFGYSAFAEQLSNNIANMNKNYLKYLIPA